MLPARILWTLGLMGLSTVGAAGVYGRYQRDIQAIKARVLAGGQIAQTACGPIEYAEQGDGTPVLAVHGAGGGYDQGLIIGSAFGEGFRIVAPSRFGYLRTPAPPEVTVQAQADAHACLLDALKIDKAVVIGASAGAPSSIEFALRFPDRTLALVLLVPAAYAPGHAIRLDHAPSSQAVFRIIMDGADFLLWAAIHTTPQFVVRFLGIPPELYAKASAADRAHVDTMMRSVLPVSWRVSGMEADGKIKIEQRPLHELKAPTLVVSAPDDLFDTLPPARYIAEQAPNARLVVYETGGHLLVGHADEQRKLLREFLESAGVIRETIQ